MISAITSPLPLFLGLNAKGINGGRAYFGDADQDPETHPKTVYWDEDGSIVVDQSNGVPIIGGYLSRNGSPSALFADGPYSIRLKDRFGAQVYYAPNVDNGISELADDINGLQQAIAVAANPVALIDSTGSLPVGATVRTADGHIYEVAPAIVMDEHIVTAGGVKLYVRDPYMTPDALGCPRDGSADDTPFVEAAFAFSHSVHLLPQSTYRLSSIIGIPDQTLYAPQGFHLIGNGAHVVVSSGEAVFTSAAAKADPDSTSNLYTAKIYFENINFTQDATSVIFNGDRLYQVVVSHCSFDAVDTVVKSFRSKGANFPDGYLQSFTFSECQFSEVRRIVDAKRGFDFTFDGNKCSSCLGGVYIDSTAADPAVNVLRWTNNLFQGGGLALVLGKALGVTISGHYGEANTLDDAATAKCDIWFKAGPGPSSAVILSGLEFQPTSGQNADADYVCVRIDTDGGGVAGFIQIDGLHTTGTRPFTPGRAEARGIGSISANTLRNALVPFNPVTARRTTFGGAMTLLASANLSAGVYRVAAIDVQYIKSMLTQPQRACSGEIKVLMQHRTAGGVVNGTSLAIIHFVAMGASEGIASANAVNDVYMTFQLDRVIQIAAGQNIDNLGAGAVTGTHFTAPALTVTRTGDQFDLKLSGYAAVTNPNYGATDRMTSNIQIEADARNSSVIRTSPIAIGS